MNLTRQQRRQLQRLSDKVDRLLDADRKFFERRPDRSFRVRRAFRQEIEANAVLEPKSADCPAGFAHFRVIRQIAPGIRMRLSIVCTADLDADTLTDDECRWLYDRCSENRPKVREIERGLFEAAAAREAQQ